MENESVAPGSSITSSTANPNVENARNNDTLTCLVSSMQTMQQTVLSLQQTVLTLAAERNTSNTALTDNSSNSNTLESATQAFQASQPQNARTSAASNQGGYSYRLPIYEFGVPLESITHIDVVPENIKKKIWEGKDINLASLLIPKTEQAKDDNEHGITVHFHNEEDPRLLKKLSITEFITIFGKYKRVMCTKYPERRVELDRYEANIVDLSNVYGHKFYDYHCQFSARAASALRDSNIKVDWSVRDLSLMQMVMGNCKTNECQHCQSTMHLTVFCPKRNEFHNSRLNHATNPSPKPFKQQDSNVDRHGRVRKFLGNKEICNNFNHNNKCYRKECIYSHICAKCHGTTHGEIACKSTTTLAPPVQKSNKQ